ncbi:hypothetical protein HMPREF0620_1452 [Parascardovia denticolens DSM 10105 = JCM 12538]|uniref:Uncharacterized protein n=1 Tax=Parascardovia denticolens DSM 10105 = JCM 12538 TaxID=864564 RepID=E6K1X9_PARDN|nr:hypothetical protein HMPREF0620_1452 [Parascardovia denticolens DSM 10105 = JCM 12538]BAR04743.1 hypothetical protein PSDT_0224 [Parascardovia denticolens DSM 10105 = JCM 12538]
MAGAPVAGIFGPIPVRIVETSRAVGMFGPLATLSPIPMVAIIGAVRAVRPVHAGLFTAVKIVGMPGLSKIVVSSR